MGQIWTLFNSVLNIMKLVVFVAKFDVESKNGNYFLYDDVWGQNISKTFSWIHRFLYLYILVLGFIYINHILQLKQFYFSTSWLVAGLKTGVHSFGKIEKRVFLPCYCHETYWVEAVRLKITILVNMSNLGQFLEKSIFCQ